MALCPMERVSPPTRVRKLSTNTEKGDYKQTGSALVAKISLTCSRAGHVNRVGNAVFVSCNRFWRVGQGAGFVNS